MYNTFEDGILYSNKIPCQYRILVMENKVKKMRVKLLENYMMGHLTKGDYNDSDYPDSVLLEFKKRINQVTIARGFRLSTSCLYT